MRCALATMKQVEEPLSPNMHHLDQPKLQVCFKAIVFLTQSFTDHEGFPSEAPLVVGIFKRQTAAGKASAFDTHQTQL